MSRHLALKSLLTTLATASVLAFDTAQAPSGATYYVLPDPPFVANECKVLLAVPTVTDALFSAHSVAKNACDRYSIDHDGYGWLSAVAQAQPVLEGYVDDPSKHALRIVEPKQPVPRNANSYILFLVTSRQIDQTIDALRSAFQDLGAAIGGKDLAVWFEDPKDSERVDTARSKYYTDKVFHFEKLGLDYNSGPYIVVTSTRPDQWTAAHDIIILKLKGISTQRTITLMNLLEQEIRTSGNPQRTALLFKEIEERVATAKDRHADIFHAIAVLILKGS